jgi:hypothetical protein
VTRRPQRRCDKRGREGRHHVCGAWQRFTARRCGRRIRPVDLPGRAAQGRIGGQRATAITFTIDPARATAARGRRAHRRWTARGNRETGRHNDVARPPFRAGRGYWAGLTPADVPRTYVARPPVRRPPGGAGPAARPGRAVNPSWRRGVVASWLRLGAFPTSGQPGCVADPSGARRQFLGRAGHFPAGTDLPLEPLDPGVAGMVLPTAACSCRFGWCGLNR